MGRNWSELGAGGGELGVGWRLAAGMGGAAV